ncbi:MAG: periplasmic heavy metal sensor [Rhodospirillales bacterium]|nr:periplasmic heavy metal sensor [Rhodospirillales bacterium]
MSRRWLWVALGVSLALNVLAGGYVAGSLWTREHRGPEGIAGELHLDAAQHAAFERHLRSMREGYRRYRDETRPLLQKALRELAKPQPDEAAVEQILEEGLSKRRALQQEHTRSTRAFLETLTPEQRERFVELMSRRMERRERPGHPAAPAR